MTTEDAVYTGYRALGYLEPGVDYEDFEMSVEDGRVPPFDGMELSTSQAARADRLLAESLVISLHDHPSVLPTDLSRYRDLTRTGRDRTGYEGLSKSGLTAFFDNFLACSTYITSQAGWKWSDILIDLGMRYCDLAMQDLVVRAETTADIENAQSSGQIALIPGLEAATMIENEVDRVDVLYGFGIRQMGITYSEANTLGSGLRERSDGGLSHFGERVVQRMNKIGMAVDIAHCGDATGMEVVQRSEAPVLITHAGARSVWPTRRMKPDDLLVACAERGGIIGIEAAPHSTLSRSHPEHSLLSVMDHFEFLVDLMGIEHVAFGPDTIYGDHVGLHEAEKIWQSNSDPFGLEGSMDEDLDDTRLDFPRVEYVAGMENPSECFGNIVRWLVANGYSDDEIQAVIGGNVIRVLEQIWR